MGGIYESCCRCRRPEVGGWKIRGLFSMMCCVKQRTDYDGRVDSREEDASAKPGENAIFAIFADRRESRRATRQRKQRNKIKRRRRQSARRQKSLM